MPWCHYRATSARPDVPWHGVAEAKQFALEIFTQDFLESQKVALVGEGEGKVPKIRFFADLTLEERKKLIAERRRRKEFGPVLPSRGSPPERALDYFR
ncbi:hypothetical protein M569_13205 [Genlisea aurea]|uniref:Uncharacterized protein n=1 Tax=Genlisea aurea TaxID=192259 RepID=S8CB33_9LAMI|nr:hypothetical protein M569_13205 [Genlisea aurea]